MHLAKFAEDQKGKEINTTQKEIGLRRKNKENADELLATKTQLEKEKKEMEVVTAAKDALLRSKINSIGNLVHDSVPVSDNEV